MRGNYYSLKTIINYLIAKGEYNAAKILEDSESFLYGITVNEAANEFVVNYDMLLNREDEVKDYVQNRMAHQFVDFIKDKLVWFEQDDDAMQAKIFRVYLRLAEPKDPILTFRTPPSFKNNSVLKEINND